MTETERRGDVLTAEQLAAVLQCSPDRIRELAERPESPLPSFNLGQRGLRFHWGDVRCWMRRQSRGKAA